VHMNAHSRRLLFAAAVITGLAATALGAGAQGPKNYYAGRSINLIVPYDPGGYYDIGARLLARHLRRHIPGQPTVVVQNQPGVGGIGLANRFAAGADQEGVTLGVLQRAIPQYAFFGYQNARFDRIKLSWIESLSAYETDSYVLILNSTHPIKSLADLKSTSIKTQLGAGRPAGRAPRT
jgi:tripartite-type tricarboxylate transporter receptor subunit TctC